MSDDPDEYIGDIAAEDEESSGVRGRAALRVAPPAPDWHAGLDCLKSGRPKDTLGNASIILQRADAWAGLRYDEFRDEPSLSRPPRIPGFDPPRGGPLDDYSVAYISQWLALRWRMKLGANVCGAAAVVASKGKGRAIHPVREYLRSIEWDGTSRLDSWLHVYAGVQEGDYVSAVGRMWMISAVARVMQKISICKTMLIFEGEQDRGKSTLLRRLCPVPEWFSDTPVDLGGGKDQYQSLRGKWIVEIPELDGFKGRDATRIKSCISSPVDNYRKSFGRTNEDVPRQCIFAGTTNEEHYFHDSTGNVRFWPVRSGSIDFDGVERDRDQLWAEAMSYYMDGHQWHISDSKLAALAREEQAEREEEDVWASALRDWVESPEGRRKCSGSICLSEVLTCSVSILKKDQGKPEQTRMGILMKKFGFKHVLGTRNPRKYIREV